MAREGALRRRPARAKNNKHEVPTLCPVPCLLFPPPRTRSIKMEQESLLPCDSNNPHRARIPGPLALLPSQRNRILIDIPKISRRSQFQLLARHQFTTTPLRPPANLIQESRAPATFCPMQFKNGRSKSSIRIRPERAYLQRTARHRLPAPSSLLPAQKEVSTEGL